MTGVSIYIVHFIYVSHNNINNNNNNRYASLIQQRSFETDKETVRRYSQSASELDVAITYKKKKNDNLRHYIILLILTKARWLSHERKVSRLSPPQSEKFITYTHYWYVTGFSPLKAKKKKRMDEKYTVVGSWIHRGHVYVFVKGEK